MIVIIKTKNEKEHVSAHDVNELPFFDGSFTIHTVWFLQTRKVALAPLVLNSPFVSPVLPIKYSRLRLLSNP